MRNVIKEKPQHCIKVYRPTPNGGKELVFAANHSNRGVVTRKHNEWARSQKNGGAK